MLHRIKFIYLMGRFTNIYLIHSMGPAKMLKKAFFHGTIEQVFLNHIRCLFTKQVKQLFSAKN